MSRWRTFRRNLLPKLAPLAYGITRLLGQSVRLSTPGWERYADEPRAIIFCGWHGRTFTATRHFRNRGVYIMVSNSRDGEMQKGIFERYGFKTIRGSTGREGVKALIETIKVLKEGAKMALTPDGPRGPSGVVQEGLIMMAQKSGALVVPVGTGCDRAWYAKSWDTWMVPKPFSNAIMMFGDPIVFEPDLSPEQAEARRKEVENAIHAIQAEADRRAGSKPPCG